MNFTESNLQKIVLDLPPSGTNNAYHTRGGKWYKDKEFAVWEQAQIIKLKQYEKKEQEKYSVGIVFYFPTLASDIDSRIKFILDVLQNAGFYKNDNKVYELNVIKEKDKDNPRVEVYVV